MRSRSTPTDRCLIAANPIALRTAEIFAGDSAEPAGSTQNFAAFSLDGGVVVLHATQFADRVKRPAGAATGDDFRELYGYDLIPFVPGVPLDEEPAWRQEAGKESVRSVERLALVDARYAGSLVRTGSQTLVEVEGRQSVAKSYRDAAWAAGGEIGPTAVPQRIAADKLNTVYGPGINFRPKLDTNSSFGTLQKPQTLSTREAALLVRYDTGDLSFALTAECLPFTDPISSDELLRRTEQWQSEARAAADRTDSLYYFGWSAHFSAFRLKIPQDKRRALLDDAVRRLGGAGTATPAKSALAALRRQLMLARIGFVGDLEAATAVKLVRELLDADPSAPNCAAAARALGRFTVRTDASVVAAIVDAVERDLSLQADWPWQLDRELRSWRHWYADLKRPLPPLEALLEKWRTKRLRA